MSWREFSVHTGGQKTRRGHSATIALFTHAHVRTTNTGQAYKLFRALTLQPQSELVSLLKACYNLLCCKCKQVLIKILPNWNSCPASSPLSLDLHYHKSRWQKLEHRMFFSILWGNSFMSGCLRSHNHCLWSPTALTCRYTPIISLPIALHLIAPALSSSVRFLPGGKVSAEYRTQKRPLICINLQVISRGEQKVYPTKSPPFHHHRNRNHPINPALPKGLSNQCKTRHRN